MLSRLILGIGLLFASIMTASWLGSVVMLCVCIVMMRAVDGHFLTIKRLLTLLQWFIWPILLLHAFLSPGQLLLPDLWIPISREGLMHGIMLALHLAAIFFAAMLMFRLLIRSEWLRLVMRLPCLGQRLVVYIWMMTSMHRSMTALLANFRWQFRLRKNIKHMPLLLMAAFQHALLAASDHAAILWLRWPDHVVMASAADMNQPTWQYRIMSGLIGSFGIAVFLMSWM